VYSAIPANKILPYNILEDSNAKIKNDNHFECVYAKGGSKPKPVVTFDGKALKEGTDYILSYKNENGMSKPAGSAVESTDIIPSDTQIRITLDCGTGSQGAAEKRADMENHLLVITMLVCFVKGHIIPRFKDLPKRRGRVNRFTSLHEWRTSRMKPVLSI
jgi:hypothetical protein